MVTEREQQRGRERKRRETQQDLMIHTPNALTARAAARLKPGVRSLTPVGLRGAEARALGPSSAAFPGTLLAGSWIKSSQDLNWCPGGMPTTGGMWQLCLLHRSAGPNSPVLKWEYSVNDLAGGPQVTKAGDAGVPLPSASCVP